MTGELVITVTYAANGGYIVAWMMHGNRYSTWCKDRGLVNDTLEDLLDSYQRSDDDDD